MTGVLVRRVDTDTQERRLCEDRGIDWGDVTTSTGTPGIVLN